uniref:Si:dkey-208b23.5 n=1 Tax=Sinocyclocheilus rhinocerous TaxID=307959 RepID=A0A673LSU8_9TELE
MVQAEKAEDEQLISALLQAVQQPLRKLFSVLSWEDTLEKVTEVAKSIMDVGEEITVDLMAKLIKFQLLTIKNNDIARRAAEQKLAFGAAIFEGVACLVYDSMDWRRQYSHYLSCIRFIQVPETCRSIQQSRPFGFTYKIKPESPVLSTEVDMRFYCDLLDRIPTEIPSVPFILHCMLEQVRMHNSPKNTDQKHPLLLNHHDERARRLHQLPVNIMKQSHVWTNLMSRHAESAIDRLTRSQELLHFCTDKSMSWSELQRLLQLFVFESMPLTTVDESGCIKGSQSDPPNPTPWDNPVEFTKHLYWSNRRIPGVTRAQEQPLQFTLKEKWQMEQEKKEAERIPIQTPSETDRKRGNIFITNVKYICL